MAYTKICPVCGKYIFKEPFEECPICGWQNDEYQEERPDKGGIGWCNIISLNEAREAYKNGKKIK